MFFTTWDSVAVAKMFDSALGFQSLPAATFRATASDLA